tara:strand:+ start:585 stop:1169 length:585 start_codon:yes stop_codon:yes gene_type:complete
MTDLSSYTHLGSALFVEIDIPSYSVLRFSDYYKPYSIGGNSFGSLGSLLSISPNKSELRATKHDLSVGITGIPSANLSAALDANIKGSTVIIYRGFYNPTTEVFVATPTKKFEGLVNNVGFQESFTGDKSDFSITFVCTSLLGILLSQSAGRRTNPVDMKRFYSTDTSFDRVPEIRNSNFNFGAPDIIPRIGTK